MEETLPALDCRSRFKAAREGVKLEIEDVASKISIDVQEQRSLVSTIEDLEADPNEATMTNIWIIKQLCHVYGVTPSTLYLGKTRSSNTRVKDICDKIHVYIANNNMTATAFTKRLGWNIEDMLRGDIESQIRNSGVDMTRDLEPLINVHWVDILSALTIER